MGHLHFLVVKRTTISRIHSDFRTWYHTCRGGNGCQQSPIPSTSASASTSSSAPGTSTNPAASDDLDTSFSNTDPVDLLDESFQTGTSSTSSASEEETAGKSQTV